MIKNKKEIAKEKRVASKSLTINVLFLLLLALAITSLMVLYINRLPSQVSEGQIATQDIRADQNYEIIDVDASDKLKEKAAQQSPLVFNYDRNLVAERKQKIYESFDAARKQIEEFYAANPEAKKLGDEDIEKLRQNFQVNLGLVLSDADFRLIYGDGFSEELEKALAAVVDSIQRYPIVYDRSELVLRGDSGILMRTINNEAGTIKEDMLTDVSDILSLEEAKNVVGKEDLGEIQKKYNLEFISGEKFKLAARLARHLIKANVVFDKLETESRRERARDNVQSVVYKLQKGQTIVRRGDRYERRHIIILDGIRKSRLQTNLILKFSGVFLLVVTTLLITYVFAQRTIKRFKPARKDLNFIGLSLILFLAILRLGSFVSSTVQDAMPFPVEITTFYYVLPIAAGAMMVRFILNAETAFVFSLVLSFFAGLFLEHSYEITVYYFLSSLVAAYVVGGVERRATVITRSVWLGVVNVVLVISLDLISRISTAATVDLQTLATNCVFAFGGGIFAGLVLLAVSPIMEAMFNYTTNIQLLELANMNHPLLREMIVRSPGTHHHSQLVGILAEAGTRSIGGNALLARVGSYYHDIGKMKKPQYFIENQKGVNPHDRLAPSMSALIIGAHVKDGMEMAREYKLPRVIADFIPEHQGTKVIGYFYHKALKEAGGDASRIDERSYRYPGPKPQSRESGVVMLADAVESAVRSLPDKSPQKIKAKVEKLVNMHFVDGQLDECELTLKDLHVIIDSFIKILIGIYHQRVEYPEEIKKIPISVVGKDKNEKAANRSDQPSSPADNIAPLFKEKRKKNS